MYRDVVADEHQHRLSRLADTIVGVAVGLAAAWLGLRLTRPRAE
jgi:uncharacterized membrane protein YccC